MVLLLACSAPVCPTGQVFGRDGLCVDAPPPPPGTGTVTHTDSPPTSACEAACPGGSVCCTPCCAQDPVSVCVEGDTCPLPNLTVDGNRAAESLSLTTESFTAESCAVLEGCVQAGDRQLVRFTTVTPNLGPAPLVLGDPSTDPRFTWSECHAHYHFEDYFEASLVDASGVRVVGHKQAFCLMDSEPWGEPTTGPVYFCGNQGITPGWADTYPSGFDCQWIDVTGIAAGAYTLRFTVDPDAQFPEADESDNTVEIPIDLP